MDSWVHPPKVFHARHPPHPPPHAHPTHNPLISTCPGFPYHTVTAVYLSDIAITTLAIFTLLTGLGSLPNTSPSSPVYQKIALIIIGSISGGFLLVHLATPLGILNGFVGALIVILLICAGGAVPILLFPEFREILHHTTQPWLLSPHVLRVLHYLFLPLYDVGLLPLAFAGPAGWGGLLVGFTAPVVALAFGAKRPFARTLATAWHTIGALELLLFVILESVFLPSFMESRSDHRQPTGLSPDGTITTVGHIEGSPSSTFYGASSWCIVQGTRSCVVNWRYLWHTVFLVTRFTVPLLLVFHGFSLWKLVVDRTPRATMLWQEEDDADLAAIYGPDSPGARDADVGALEPILHGSATGEKDSGAKPEAAKENGV